jgi:hypothetical protein
VVLYDISGDTAVKRSSLSLPVEPAMIAVSGNRLYTAGYVPMQNDAFFVAADVDNPAAPAVLGSCPISGLKWNGKLAVSGQYVYYSAQVGTSWPYSGAIGVVNAGDPAKPVAMGNLDLGGVAADAFAIDGGWLYVQRNYVKDGPAPMFFAYSLTPPLTATKVGEQAIGETEESNGLFALGGRIYSALGSAGVRVIGANNGALSPLHQFPVKTGDSKNNAVDAYAAGNLLYVATSDGGVFVYNVENAQSPALLGTVPMKGASRVSGSSGVVAALATEGDTGLRKIVFSGGTPAAGAGAASPLHAAGVLLHENRLYLGAEGLFIYNAQDPASPELLSNKSDWNNILPLAVVGNTLYGLTSAPDSWERQILSIINVTDPANPTKVKKLCCLQGARQRGDLRIQGLPPAPGDGGRGRNRRHFQAERDNQDRGSPLPQLRPVRSARHRRLRQSGLHRRLYRRGESGLYLRRDQRRQPGAEINADPQSWKHPALVERRLALRFLEH